MNKERLHELVEENDGKFTVTGVCHDCKSNCTVSATALEDGIHIEGGSVYDPYGDDRYYVKCNECFETDPMLRHYQDCEVYARVVGYLRPIKQFNEAKYAEFHDRVNFKI